MNGSGLGRCNKDDRVGLFSALGFGRGLVSAFKLDRPENEAQNMIRLGTGMCGKLQNVTEQVKHHADCLGK